MKRALIPINLDMTQFGEKADKVAMILDKMYRTIIYKDAYGFLRRKRDWNTPVALSMKKLKEEIKENPAPIMEMICLSYRHDERGDAPIFEIIERVVKAKKGVCATKYSLLPEFKIKPRLYPLKRNHYSFLHDKEKEAEMIAGWPEPYQFVCGHIKKLSLDMDEQQCDELAQRIRNEYLQKDKKQWINDRSFQLKKRYPNMSEDEIRRRATVYAEKKHNTKRIAELDEENYDSLLFIQDKYWEVEGREEFPIYSLDKQGRLHYYLTNMSEEMRPYIRFDGCKMVSYDLGTSQCVFVWVTLQEYIRENNITLSDLKEQADEILDTIAKCSNGNIPDYIKDSLDKLKRRRSEFMLSFEMMQLGKLLSKDFYHDIMETIDWKRLPNGEFDRKKFKGDVLFPFLYGKKPSWGKSETKPEKKTMMQYFLKKFPRVYCVLWQMRQFTKICLEYNNMIQNKVNPTIALNIVADKYQTSEFPKEMQRREANMFYNIIIPQIKQPLVTIHDSIIIQAGKKCDVMNIIKQAFKDEYNIDVSVKYEYWSNPLSAL